MSTYHCMLINSSVQHIFILEDRWPNLSVHAFSWKIDLVASLTCCYHHKQGPIPRQVISRPISLFPNRGCPQPHSAYKYEVVVNTLIKFILKTLATSSLITKGTVGVRKAKQSWSVPLATGGTSLPCCIYIDKNAYFLYGPDIHSCCNC